MQKKEMFDGSVEPETLEKMPFPQKYEGYVVDLIRELAHEVKFKYEMYNVEDEEYGRQREDGSWTGMIGDLISHVSSKNYLS